MRHRSPQVHLTLPRRPAAALVGILLGLLLPAFAHAAIERHFELKGDRLLVGNLAGKVEIVPAGGDLFRVEATIDGHDASADALRFETGEESSSSRFIVRYPTERTHDYVYPPMGKGFTSEFHYDPEHLGEDSLLRRLLGKRGKRVTVRGQGKGMEIWADLKIFVPRDRHCRIVLGCGTVEAHDTRGELDLDLISGSVEARDLQGPVTIDTGSASVKILRLDGDLSVDTGSGEVELGEVQGGIEVDTGSGAVSAHRLQGNELSVDTGSGAVVLQDLQAKELNVDTGSGSVRIEDVQCDEMSVDTGTGSVQGQRVDCDALQVDTGSGRVIFEGLSAEGANVDTGTGGIELRLVHMGAGDFTLESGTGDIDLRLPENASASIAASGRRIELERTDATIEEKSQHTLRAKLGAGTALIEAETATGTIHIR